jgi:hypothetical protein
MKEILLILVLATLVSCNERKETTDSIHGTFGTAEELRRQIKKSDEGEFTDFDKPKADIDELEREINNGGFNQYFFNSSGQNCFETLDSLKTKKEEYYTNLTRLLSQAIEVVNLDNLPEDELMKKIRNRDLESLENDSINKILDSLDTVYYGN